MNIQVQSDSKCVCNFWGEGGLFLGICASLFFHMLFNNYSLYLYLDEHTSTEGLKIIVRSAHINVITEVSYSMDEARNRGRSL